LGVNSTLSGAPFAPRRISTAAPRGTQRWRRFAVRKRLDHRCSPSARQL